MRNCGRVSLLLTLFLIVPQQASAITALYSLSYGARSVGMAGVTLASGGIDEGGLYVNCKIDRMAVGNLAQHLQSQRLGTE